MKSIPATLMFLALNRRAYEQRQRPVDCPEIVTSEDLQAGEIVDLPSAIGTAGVTDFSARPNDGQALSPHLTSDASTTPLPQHPAPDSPEGFCRQSGAGLLSVIAELDKQIAVTRELTQMMREMNDSAERKP